MKITHNIFGTEPLCDENDFCDGKIYTICTACTSIYSEFLSWANEHKDRMIKNPEKANNIIVLGCQVTDLAILNDIKTIEKLMSKYPDKKFFMGGCLAQRMDIPLPLGVNRLAGVRSDYQPLDDMSLIEYAKPFWVKNFKESEEPSLYDEKIKDGHLFRHEYPIRIGAGCKGKCTYCSIRHTRGVAYELDINKLKEQFEDHDSVVLIADNPTVDKLKAWINEAYDHCSTQISIRNVEPATALAVWDDLIKIAGKQLKVFHCPIQSDRIETLQAMKRPVEATMHFISKAWELQKYNVICATNVIVDYLDYPNPTDNVYKLFDYVSWNPYWNGKWNREQAEQRFKKYFGH